MINKSSAKSAYEIRLDLLKLSFDILQSQCNAKAGEQANSISSAILITTSPSVEEVISNARALNDFVSEKPSN